MDHKFRNLRLPLLIFVNFVVKMLVSRAYVNRAYNETMMRSTSRTPRRLLLGFLVSFAVVPGLLAGPVEPMTCPDMDMLIPAADLADLPSLTLVTRKKDGSLRDPVNLVLVGDSAAVSQAMVGAGWDPADRHVFGHVLHEVADVVDHRNYKRAPVSHSYLFGRIEDMAFEQEVGGSPKRRHHVRLWKAPFLLRGADVWMAAATYDRTIRVFPPDHKTERYLDVERDYLVATLETSQSVRETLWIPGFDPAGLKSATKYLTDGRVALLQLKPVPTPGPTPSVPSRESHPKKR